MTITATQTDTILAAIRDASREIVLPNFRKLQSSSIETKSGPHDLVTIADRQAEAQIIAALRPVFPDACFIGEEASAADPSLLTQLDNAPLAVVIDPIDGTWNYANGLGVFGMMLAITIKGDPVFGVLYDPLGDDWIAVIRGKGAWIGRPGQPDIPLTATDTARDVTGIVYREALSDPEKLHLAPYIGGYPSPDPLRCSCHEYRLLANGAIDFVLTGHDPMPWDHLAGQVVVEELGGTVTPWHPRDEGYPRRLSAIRSLRGTVLDLAERP